MIVKYSDLKNRNKLSEYGLPIILSKEQFLSIFEISNKEATYFYSNNRKKLYRKFTIKKRNGGERTIEAPRKDLKMMQKATNLVLLQSLPQSESVTSFIKGKSIIDNALPHSGAKTLLKFDIKNFFPSISMKQIYWFFRHLGYSSDVSRCFGLLCVNGDYVLPQGAPTSPLLSNLIARRIDERICGFCKKNRDTLDLVYTRYADDITLSSKRKLDDGLILKIKNVVYAIITDVGFLPNNDKFRVFKSGQKLMVTGLVVNEQGKVYVEKKRIREIEIALHCINRFGLTKHIEFLSTKRNKHWWWKDYINHLFGLIDFVKMVDHNKGEKYKHLLLESLKKWNQ